MIKHTGGCHCGRVRFEVLAPEDIPASECNCSICTKSGHVGLIVPKERFTLLQGEGLLSTYTFNTGVAKHLFCSHCGIKSFYIPRSHPDGVSVNVSCLDAGTVKSVRAKPFNGQEWEKQHPSGRAESYPE
ncbi:MAG: GFA family protein [Gammaproteobacteria bacterium]|nr:GFA family protein [Gammaproteobacteria bacterium]